MISEGFHTLFNLPEIIALSGASSEEYYWRLVLQYGLDGNMQAMLDEYVRVLAESLGLAGHGYGTAAERLGSAKAGETDRILANYQICLAPPELNGKRAKVAMD